MTQKIPPQLAIYIKQLYYRVLEVYQRWSVWVIGPILIGLMAVGLATGSDYMSHLNTRLVQLHPYAPLLLMPLGFAFLAYLGTRFFPGAAGSGIPQTIAATDAPSGVSVSYLLSWRIAAGKAFLTLGGLGLGASIGREGPTIQIGAAIMHSFFGRKFFESVESRRALILAGGAAGIAAAFNAPLAGIMFAIEELSKKHIFSANSPTVVTIVGSGLISLSILGSYTYFGTTESFLTWHGGILAVLLCGLVGGAGGGVFSRLFIFITFNLPTRLATFVQKKYVLFAATCGLVIAIIGILTDGMIYGAGYLPTQLSLEDKISLPWYFSIAKLFATLLSSVCGLPGGIFAPSLSVGAGLGDNLAALMQLVLPTIADRSAIVLLVMAAYLSGVTRAPVTSFIICMEMTDSHEMLLPLMAASVVASWISTFISPTPLYHKLAELFVASPHQK